MPLGLGTFVAANHNVVDVWRQAIDLNGDGRIDIIDAAEQPMKWVVYLNTPGGNTSGVKWKKTSFSVIRLAAELSSRGHTLGNRVPLSRRATSGSVKLSTCWRWDGSNWRWFNGWGQRCFGDPTRVLDREPERTLIEWELSDLNGDGYPDFVFNSTPVRFQLMRPQNPPGLGEDDVRYGDVWVPFAPAAVNQVRAAYNIVGVRFDYDEPNPFARSVTLQANDAEDGVGVWVDADIGQTNVQRQIVGQADVNGDGLLDRVVNTRAYLGIYIGTARAFSNM